MTLRIAVWLTAILLSVGSPVLADVVTPEEPDRDTEVIDLGGPYVAGRLEISPIMSMSMSGRSIVYRAGVSVGYTMTRTMQLGGMFVMGNRIWDRTSRREVTVIPPGNDLSGNYLSVDDGFGASLTGYLRYNIPFAVQKKVYPFLEVFGGHDFWAWGDISELGGGAGVRKMLSKKTALTTFYGYSVMFADGQRVGRHVVTAGVSVFFR